MSFGFLVKTKDFAFSAPSRSTSLSLAFVKQTKSKRDSHHQTDGEIEVARAVLAAHGLDEVSKGADASLGALRDDCGPIEVAVGVGGGRGCRGRDGSEQVAAGCVRCVLFVLSLLVSDWRKRTGKEKKEKSCSSVLISSQQIMNP